MSELPDISLLLKLPNVKAGLFKVCCICCWWWLILCCCCCCCCCCIDYYCREPYHILVEAAEETADSYPSAAAAAAVGLVVVAVDDVPLPGLVLLAPVPVVAPVPAYTKVGIVHLYELQLHVGDALVHAVRALDAPGDVLHVDADDVAVLAWDDIPEEGHLDFESCSLRLQGVVAVVVVEMIEAAAAAAEPVVAVVLVAVIDDGDIPPIVHPRLAVHPIGPRMDSLLQCLHLLHHQRLGSGDEDLPHRAYVDAVVIGDY
mmetsp:Transcript_17635/g.26715  ORF Transcript_17635/g.26715 Transcript_17635/m.26715 type:complete len:259 (-) Transcript_17635:978-1754(-)